MLTDDSLSGGMLTLRTTVAVIGRTTDTAATNHRGERLRDQCSTWNIASHHRTPVPKHPFAGPRCRGRAPPAPTQDTRGSHASPVLSWPAQTYHVRFRRKSAASWGETPLPPPHHPLPVLSPSRVLRLWTRRYEPFQTSDTRAACHTVLRLLRWLSP